MKSRASVNHGRRRWVNHSRGLLVNGAYPPSEKVEVSPPSAKR